MSYKIIDCEFDWSTINDYENHTLAIRCDFVGGEGAPTVPLVIELPPNVTLQFEGGSFSGVTLEGDNTRIVAPLEKIFDTSVNLKGSFVYDTFYPEWFGAKGDGVINDFTAMKTTCEFADHVTLTQKYRIYEPISSTDPNPEIEIEKENFTLLGYGSKITDAVIYDPSDNPLIMSYPIFTFKNINNLVVEGVTIDGNKRMSKGITLDNVAKGTLRDITVSNLQNSLAGRNSIGLEVFVIDGSKIHGDNIRISEIGGGQNGTIDEGVGIGRAIYINLDNDIDGLGEEGIKAVTQKTKITFDNSFLEWVYGDDGDVIDIIDQNYISDALHRFIFTNCTIRYASRRLVKGSASGIQYYNCKFDTASEADLIAKMNPNMTPPIIKPKPSGGVNFRNADPVHNPNFRNMHGKMINCEYRNTGNLDIDSGHTLIAAYTNGVEIRGNKFYDSYIRFQDKTSNFIVDNNQFYNSNIVTTLIRDTEDPDLNDWENGISYITNNYGRYDPAGPSHSALIDAYDDLISLSINNNKVSSIENATTTVGFHGLLRQTRGKSTKLIVGKDVIVSSNEVTRINSVRKEYLIVSDAATWYNTCKLFNNYLSVKGQAYIGANFYNANSLFVGFYWNNRTGDGNEMGVY